MDIYEITASALTSQRLRLDTISSNLANANSTRKADGSIGAYRRKEVIFAPLLDQQNKKMGNMGGGAEATGEFFPMKPTPSGMSMGPNGRPMITLGVQKTQFDGAGVTVSEIREDKTSPVRLEYNPSHPDANKDGMVEMPNINMVKEMIDMISANRAYEANVTAFQSAKNMESAALQI
jgi:flagellar basal-body rod protein FlgC